MTTSTAVQNFNEAFVNAFFESTDIKIILSPEETEKNFNGDLDYFYRFMKEEANFWSSIPDVNGTSLYHVINFFQSIVDELERAMGEQVSNPSYAQDIIIKAINKTKEKNKYAIYSSSDMGNYLKEQFQISSSSGQAAFTYLIDGSTHNITSKESFKSVMNAYLWEQQNKIPEPNISALNNALKQLKNNFEKDRDELNLDIKSKQKDIEVFINEKKNELSDLVTLYTEKLKLEGPATYWNQLSDDYQTKGDTWRNWAIGTAVIFALVLMIILFGNPVTIFQGNQLSMDSLKSTLLLGLFSSIVIYLIRLFVLLAKSAYHLSRDAKERYQLTFVYLALVKEKSINDAERTIILQALFARADTGLLNGDSSPAIPEGLLTQLIKNNTGTSKP